MSKISDHDLILAVLSGESQRSIANRYNISESALSKRIHRPTFQYQLSEYRSQIIDATLTELSSYATEAVEALAEVLKSDNDFAKLQAAIKILDYTLSYSHQHDLLRQIRELKELQDAQNDIFTV